MFGSVLNAGKFPNTSQTWKDTLKQITLKGCSLTVVSVQKYSNQGEVCETTSATFIKRNMAPPHFPSSLIRLCFYLFLSKQGHPLLQKNGNISWIQMKNISSKSWLLLLFILFKPFTCFQSTSLIWIWTKRLSGGWIGLWGEMARGSFTAAEFAQELTKIKRRWDITLRLILTAITVVQFVSSNIKQEEP